MNLYDKQYYFVRQTENDRYPFLTPDLETGDREPQFYAEPMGSMPLVFYNGFKEFQRENRIPMMKVPPDILFSAGNMLVPADICEALRELNIPSLHMHPAVYIHDDGEWYEGKWYMTFTERFDCWDRKTSKVGNNPPHVYNCLEYYNVFSYSLNKELLDKTPLEQRLLFEMGGTIDPYIVCHESMLKYFSAKGYTGAMFTRISDY